MLLLVAWTDDHCIGAFQIARGALPAVDFPHCRCHSDNGGGSENRYENYDACGQPGHCGVGEAQSEVVQRGMGLVMVDREMEVLEKRVFNLSSLCI